MFTGIVEEIGVVKAIAKGTHSIKLSIKAKKVLENTQLGDSIAVNGVCLTVTFLASDYFIADVMPESMRKTNMVSKEWAVIAVSWVIAVSCGFQRNGRS